MSFITAITLQIFTITKLIDITEIAKPLKMNRNYLKRKNGKNLHNANRSATLSFRCALH